MNARTLLTQATSQVLRTTTMRGYLRHMALLWLGVLCFGSVLHRGDAYGRRHYTQPCTPVAEDLGNLRPDWMRSGRAFYLPDDTKYLTSYHYGDTSCAICLPEGPHRILSCMFNPVVVGLAPTTPVHGPVRNICKDAVHMNLAPQITVLFQENEGGVLGPQKSLTTTNGRVAGFFQVGQMLLEGTLNCTDWAVPATPDPIPYKEL